MRDNTMYEHIKYKYKIMCVFSSSNIHRLATYEQMALQRCFLDPASEYRVRSSLLEDRIQTTSQNHRKTPQS